MATRSWRTVFLLTFFSIIGFSCGLRIHRLTVPNIIQANASDVILDCDYTVEEWEKSLGFVLTWYVNKVNLVYQWIPPLLPQAIGTLKGRIDPYFRRSDDPWEQYRALRILRPDPGLSGTYSCTVSTFEEEDTDSANLLVWAAPSHVKLTYWRPSFHLVNVSCSAFDVSPKPEFSLYLRDPSGIRHSVKVRGRTDVSGKDSGLFQSHSWGLILFSNISDDSTLGCTVHTQTIFSETSEKIYHSDLPIITTTTTTVRSGNKRTTPLPDEEAIRSPDMTNFAPSVTGFRSPEAYPCWSKYRSYVLQFIDWKGAFSLILLLRWTL